MDRLREDAFRALQHCVQEIPGAHVSVFGSAVTGFGGQSSDLDLSIEVPLARLVELFPMFILIPS